MALGCKHSVHAAACSWRGLAASSGELSQRVGAALIAVSCNPPFLSFAQGLTVLVQACYAVVPVSSVAMWVLSAPGIDRLGHAGVREGRDANCFLGARVLQKCMTPEMCGMMGSSSSSAGTRRGIS